VHHCHLAHRRNEPRRQMPCAELAFASWAYVQCRIGPWPPAKMNILRRRSNKERETHTCTSLVCGAILLQLAEAPRTLLNRQAQRSGVNSKNSVRLYEMKLLAWSQQ
jgi:hypothetical protein